MKGYAIANRLKQKDAYDIYYSIRNFPGGVDALVEATRPLLDFEAARTGYLNISKKFRHSAARSARDGGPGPGEGVGRQPDHRYDGGHSDDIRHFLVEAFGANRAAARWVINTAVSTSPAETFFGGSARNCWLGR